MKFRYLGNSEEMVAYGYDFRNGNEPDVTDENAIKRLSGNRFFEALPEEEEVETEQEKPQEEQKEEADLTAENVDTEAKTTVEEETPAQVEAEAAPEAPAAKRRGRAAQAQ